MSTPPPSNRPTPDKLRAALGRGPAQPGRIEKAGDPRRALTRLAGRTSFVIAHRLSTIRDADNVIVIRDGEIVEQGTFPQLLDAKGFFHHLYMSQFKGLTI